MASAIVLSGLVVGLSAGASPGPLLSLVISETLNHGTRAGTKVEGGKKPKSRRP